MSLKKANKSEKEVEKMRVISLTKEVWGLEKVAKLEEMWGSLPEEAKTRYHWVVFMKKHGVNRGHGRIRGV
jgi:hypothetical protein